MKNIVILSIACLIFATSCISKEISETTMDIKPPKADKIPKYLEIHDDIRLDNYYWLNQKDNDEVIDYLERENAYYEKMTHNKRIYMKSLEVG